MAPKFSLKHPCLIHEALARAERYLEASGAFYGHGTDNAWDESVLLLFWAMGLTEDPGESLLSQPFDPVCAKKFIQAINVRASDKIPAAYITGESWYCGYRFFVDNSVLVPRSPIGELIQNSYRPWLASSPKRILDLCCGSGCIGIAAAIYDERSRVDIADLSAEALVVANRNVERYALEDRVRVHQSDLFDGLQGERFDLIMSNPPYVDREDLASMPSEYLHEPAIALGSGEDGLDIARKILNQAASYLTDNGALVLEVGNSAVHLERAFPEVPFTWICFENGGDGVCVLTRQELEKYPF